MDSNSGRWFATQQVIKQIADEPLGHGISSFSSEYNKAKARYFENNSNWNEMKNAGFIFNANNDFLELTYEFGVVWISIFIGFFVLLFYKKPNTIEEKITRTIIVCVLVHSMTNPVLIIPVVVLIAIVCVVINVNTASAKTFFETQNNKIITAGIGFFLITIILIRLNSEYKLCRLYDGNGYLKGENQIKSYVSKIDHNGEEYFMGASIYFNAKYYNQGVEYLNIAFERSGKPSAGTIVAGILKKEKKFSQAETIYNYNKNAEPYRYEARIELLNLFIETNQKGKAIKMAKEIINLPIKIPSQTVKMYKKRAKNYLINTN